MSVTTPEGKQKLAWERACADLVAGASLAEIVIRLRIEYRRIYRIQRGRSIVGDYSAN